MRLRLFLKLKRGTESKEEGPRFYFALKFWSFDQKKNSESFRILSLKY